MTIDFEVPTRTLVDHRRAHRRTCVLRVDSIFPSHLPGCVGVPGRGRRGGTRASAQSRSAGRGLRGARRTPTRERWWASRSTDTKGGARMKTPRRHAARLLDLKPDITGLRMKDFKGVTRRPWRKSRRSYAK